MILPFTTALSVLSALSLLVPTTAQTTPSGTFAPSYVPCQGNVTFIRSASSGLAQGELDWLRIREKNVITALETYLADVKIPGFDYKAYIAQLKASIVTNGKYVKKDKRNNSGTGSKVPVIALSFSGGGTRAELCELGLYDALDGRVEKSKQAGTGGLLQATTYLSGLSGGALTTTGLAVNGFPTLQTLISGGQLSQAPVNTSNYAALGLKAQLGFPVTFADIISVNSFFYFLTSLINPSINPLSWTWSGLRKQDAFSKGQTPMPILMTAEVLVQGDPQAQIYNSPNGSILLAPDTDTLYETTPFEFGSWTGRTRAFTDTAYLGTGLYNGQPQNSSLCVNGFDSAAFVGGSALSALNFWFAEVVSNGTVAPFARRSLPDEPQFVERHIPPQARQIGSTGQGFPKLPYPANEDTLNRQKTVNAVRGIVGAIPEFVGLLQQQNYSTVIYPTWPNPFFGYNASASSYIPYLFPVDGSETGQLNPLWPLIQPARKLDFAIVSDNGGTEISTGWMNGTGFRNTYIAARRQNIPFPEIPSIRTMLNLGHTSRPVFYGCNEPNSPLILYASDFPYTAYTNISFTASALTNSQIQLLTNNTLPLISQNGGQLRANWPACVACGSIYKSLQRMQWSIPDVCKKCMDDYCWDGRVDDSQPGFLAPELVLQPGLSWSQWNSTVFYK